MRSMLVIMAGALSLSFAPVGKAKRVCDGFFPKNNIIIPMSMMADGISETEFNGVLDRLEKVYAPIVSQHGGKLVVERDWQDGEFNAYASQDGFSPEWIVHFFGGMARAKGMTIEGFTIVTCHEMGHHLGGAPKVRNPFTKKDDWASNEGQADYFATLRCLKQVWTPAENANYVQNKQVNATARKDCEAAHSDVNEQNICMRATMGALDLTGAFNTYIKAKTPLSLDTPDSKVVSKTDDSHPQSQCRLDTYFQGALCDADVRIPLDNKDPRVGTCTVEKGQRVGVRPRCWYAPI